MVQNGKTSTFHLIATVQFDCLFAVSAAAIG